MNDAGYVRSVEEDRAETQASLRRFPSVLYAVARHEVPIGARIRVAADAAADVRLPGIDRAVAIEALADGFRVDGEPSGPRAIDAGRYSLRLSHQGYPAIVVFDREAAVADVELRWFPVDPGLRIRTALEPDPARVAVSSTASAPRPADRAGWIRFTVGGVECRLAAVHMLEPGYPEGHLDVFFRDATSGRESYEVGRYVTVERDGDEVVVDFNRAYDPACALSPYFNCPIPPPENRLPVAIRAGEMAPRTGDARTDS